MLIFFQTNSPHKYLRLFFSLEVTFSLILLSNILQLVVMIYWHLFGMAFLQKSSKRKAGMCSARFLWRNNWNVSVQTVLEIWLRPVLHRILRSVWVWGERVPELPAEGTSFIFFLFYRFFNFSNTCNKGNFFHPIRHVVSQPLLGLLCGSLAMWSNR